MAESSHKTAVTRKTRSVRPPTVRRPHPMMPGTAATTRAMRQPLLQPALKVGAASDPLEREAETMAERVVAMSVPQLTAPDAVTPPGGPADARRAAVDDQPNTEELEAVPPIPEDHQDPVVPPQEEVTTEDLTAGDMEELETGKPAETGGEPPVEPTVTPAPPGATGEEEAQAARGDAGLLHGPTVGAEGGPAPADVAARVAQPGSGRPLPAELRAFMEPRFNRDFSAVRVHDAAEDRRAARRIGARAFTHREHIWLGPGERVEDRKLIAHELTHVVQQTVPAPTPLARLAEPALEDENQPEIRRGYVLDKAEKYARNVPGYRLIEVILGRSPITGDRVERNAINLLGAMMSLVPGGNLLFERLQETHVLEDAFQWVSDRLTSLNITWTRITSIVEDIIDYMPDWPSDMIAYAKRKLSPLVDDILTFIGEVTEKILEFIIRGALKLAGPWADKVWEVIQQAGSVISTILEDPLGFAKNLFAAVLKGFRQFGDNIIEHIKKGLLGWLFGAIRGLDIQVPERLDFKGLISIGLQIVGLTYANFRRILVKRLGKNGERKVTFLEKSVEVVKVLVNEGFVGLWQRVLQMIDNFKEKIVGGIQKFVIETLIMGGLSWLAGISNPVGAIVKVVLAIYNMIKTFLERLDQILEVARSIFSSIGAIASGQIQQAADFIERTLAATIPVVISFLAALVPITGITNAIRNIIAKLRAAVERAIDRMISFVVKKAQKLFSKLIAKLNGKRKLPSANFMIGKSSHRIYAKKERNDVEIYVQSTEKKAKEAADEMKAETTKFKEGGDSAKEAQKAAKTFDEEEEGANKEADKVDPNSEKDNQRKPMEKLEERLANAATKISTAAQPLADNPDVKTDDPEKLIRAVEPRFDEEGLVAQYKAVKEKSGEPAPGTGLPFSQYYEADHLPEKQLLQATKGKLAQFTGPGATPAGSSAKAPAKPEETLREAPESAAPAQAVAPQPKSPGFGRLADLADDPKGDGPNLNAILIYRPVHRLKPNTFSGPTLKRLDEIAASAAPAAEKETQAKTAIEEQIHDEAVALKRIYGESDEASSGALRKRVFGNIDQIVEKSNTDYNLSAKPAPQKAEEGGPGETGARNALAFGGPQDFSHREGVADAYGRLGATGAFFERDHIIDQSFPYAAKAITYGDVLGRSKINLDVLAKAAPDDASRRSIAARAGALRRRPLFAAGSAMAGYTEGNGVAINLYRAVHRRVTAASVATNARTSILSKLPSSAFEKAEAYIRGDDGTSVRDADADVLSGVRSAFTGQLDTHMNAVKAAYGAELNNVEQANPGREAAARKAMQPIVDRVNTSLGDMRRRSLNLLG